MDLKINMLKNNHPVVTFLHILVTLQCALHRLIMVQGEQVEVQQGQWGKWSEVSECSVTCGSGVVKMMRTWIPGPNDPPKKTYTNEYYSTCTPSGRTYCPIDGEWSSWWVTSQCSVMCGGGKKTRTRECMGRANGGKTCMGDKNDEIDCNEIPCPELPFNFDMSQCQESKNYTCASGKMCIPIEQRCDRYMQCHDGTDEKDCPRYNYNTGTSSFLQSAIAGNIFAAIVMFVCSKNAMIS